MRFKIANAFKGFTMLADEPMEQMFDRVLRSLTVPMSRPVDEIIAHCIERERQISGCLDSGLVLSDPNPAAGFSSELILALGVSPRGLRWRWETGVPRYAPQDISVHCVLVVLAPDDRCRLRALRAVSSALAPGRDPCRSILGATSLDQVIAAVRAFEESQ